MKLSDERLTDERLDTRLDLDLAEAFRRKLQRLARAQALAWNSLKGEDQQKFLAEADQMEGK